MQGLAALMTPSFIEEFNSAFVDMRDGKASKFDGVMNGFFLYMTGNWYWDYDLASCHQIPAPFPLKHKFY